MDIEPAKPVVNGCMWPPGVSGNPWPTGWKWHGILARLPEDLRGGGDDEGPRAA
jgi:hypothetical protein